MLYHNMKAALLIACFSMHAAQQQIAQQLVLAPSKLGTISLYHDDAGFTVKTPSASHAIQPQFVSADLRRMPSATLHRFLKNGSISLQVNKMNNSNDYTVSMHGKVRGGGPIIATVGLWTGAFVFYGIPIIIMYKTIQGGVWLTEQTRQFVQSELKKRREAAAQREEQPEGVITHQPGAAGHYVVDGDQQVEGQNIPPHRANE